MRLCDAAHVVGIDASWLATLAKRGRIRRLPDGRFLAEDVYRFARERQMAKKGAVAKTE
jgi:hypothetical protein